MYFCGFMYSLCFFLSIRYMALNNGLLNRHNVSFLNENCFEVVGFKELIKGFVTFWKSYLFFKTKFCDILREYTGNYYSPDCL